MTVLVDRFRMILVKGEIRMTMLKIKTNLAAGGIKFNHNQGLPIRTRVKAGGVKFNHNQNR
ncbi:MAG: hypothetical protein NTY38_06020 [Acidobacteria bacterium]|nr:hypothetical protein [Acidobacteriota bacterium]